MTDGKPHTITITFADSDSVNASVSAENIHPNQFFVAAALCEQLAYEYYARHRAEELAQQERNTIQVARSFIERQ